MKVIIHTQYYPPELGAPQARLSEFAEGMASKGHDVIVLTAMPNYPQGKIYSGYKGLYRRETRNGVRVIRTWIYPTKSVGLLRRLTNYFSFVISSLFFGAALLPKADYLLTESPPLFLGIAGYLLSRIKRARWIFNVSDLWPESAVRLGVIGEGLPLKISERLESFCYRKSWLVTGQSREILESVRLKVPDVQTYHFSNGVDTCLFTPALRSGALHEELGEGAECVAIYAGLHGIAQGLNQIIEAASMLEILEGRLKIVLIGDGAEKESLQRMAEGMRLVKFLPPRSKKEIPRLLASCDVALVPLKTYIPGAVPSKLYEAMASGLPVVLVAEGEASKILNESQAGIAVVPGAPNRLAQALSRLTLDKELRQRFGANGKQAASERFDRGTLIANFLRVLEGNA